MGVLLDMEENGADFKTKKAAAAVIAKNRKKISDFYFGNYREGVIGEEIKQSRDLWAGYDKIT
jgi:hypothetical protein